MSSAADTLSTGLGRVLLPYIPVGRAFYGESGLEFAAIDYSVIPFLIEEFIALGACGIVYRSLEEPKYLRSVVIPELRRCFIVDNGRRDKDVVNTLAPLSEEFECEISGGGSVMRRLTPSNSSADIPGPQIMEVAGALLALLIGQRYEAEVQIDLPAVQGALEQLDRICRSSRARATVAVLRSVFSAYRPVQTDTVVVKPNATEQQLSLFLRFVEDSTYREMSRAARGFGMPGRSRRAAQLFSRAARALVQKTPFRQAVNLGSKGLSAATHLPMPDADVASSLFRKDYLPPVVNLSDAMRRATEQWHRVNPGFVLPQSAGPIPEDTIDRPIPNWGRKAEPDG
jgi:predicted transport protein